MRSAALSISQVDAPSGDFPGVRFREHEANLEEGIVGLGSFSGRECNLDVDNGGAAIVNCAEPLSRQLNDEVALTVGELRGRVYLYRCYVTNNLNRGVAARRRKNSLEYSPSVDASLRVVADIDSSKYLRNAISRTIGHRSAGKAVDKVSECATWHCHCVFGTSGPDDVSTYYQLRQTRPSDDNISDASFAVDFEIGERWAHDDSSSADE